MRPIKVWGLGFTLGGGFKSLTQEATLKYRANREHAKRSLAKRNPIKMSLAKISLVKIGLVKIGLVKRISTKRK